MDIEVQPKLLKSIEEKRFRRLGDVRERAVDVRLIAATHRDLAALAAENKFRRDLYYRINTFRLTIPPLEETGLGGYRSGKGPFLMVAHNGTLFLDEIGGCGRNRDMSSTRPAWANAVPLI